MSAGIAETQGEHLHRLNYHNKFPIEDILDVATYVPEHKLFHTSDGRFCAAWFLRGVPDEVLTQENRYYYSDALAYALNQYPIGSCGQFIRYNHGDIRAQLNRFTANQSDSPFAKDLVNSIIGRQVTGATEGFFSDISQEMVDSARTDLLAEMNDPTAKEAMSEIIENSSHTGRYAHTSEIVLTFIYEPYWVKSGFVISKFATRLAAAFGIGGAQSEYELAYKKEVKAFKNHALKIQNALSKYGLSPRVVTGQGLVETLYRELNPERKLRTNAPAYTSKISLRAMMNGACRDPDKDLPRAAAFTPIETHGEGWKIDKTYYCTTSLRELPNATRPGMLSEVLADMEGESWSAINFHVGNQAYIRARLKIRRTTLSSKQGLGQTSTFAKPDPVLMQKNFDDISMVENATNPEERDVQLVVNASVHISMKSKSLQTASKMADDLEDGLWHYGYHERDRGDAVMHSMVPFNFKPKAKSLLQRSRDIMTANLADLAPIFIPFQGVDEDTILVNNAKGEPIFLSLLGKHVVAGHSLIVGGTGSGKSFLVNSLLMQMMAKVNPKIFMIDKGASYKSLCVSSGGSYISLAVEEDGDARPVCLNPFYVSPDSEGNPRRPRTSEIFFMHRVLLSMIQSGTGGDTGIDAGLTKEDSTLLFRALREMFERNKHDLTQECTLGEFVTVLSDFGGERGSKLADKLYEFTSEGIYGALFDGPIGVNWDADMIVIETDKLDGSAAMSVIMLVLFYQIDLYCKYRLPRDRMKFIGIDEAWAALSDPTGTIPRLVGGYFREMRKYMCAVALISQGLGDFVTLVSSESKNGGGKSGILINTKHFFLLSSSEEDVELAKKTLNISIPEANLWRSVSSLPPFYSECFYRVITAKDEPYAGKFRLYSNPVSLWLATTDPHDVQMRDNLIRKLLPDSNGDRIEATRKAANQLAEEYPYGSKYKRVA